MPPDLNFTDMNDRLHGNSPLAVARRFVDAIERVQLGELVEWETSLQEQVEKLRDCLLYTSRCV